MSRGLRETGYGLLPLPDVPPELIRAFDCGKPRLNEFLQERALSFHETRLSLCWVVLHADHSDHAIGYFTLSNDSVPLSSSEETDLGLLDHSGLTRFPAVTIGRLAVASTFHGTGASTQLMHMALDQIRGDISTFSAARLASVDADNDSKVLQYYERHGFQRSLWADKQAKNHASKPQTRQTVKMLRDILIPW
ncbi:GNAT family N-acetyltransferase [Hydrogenophaga aromaticivorans]|uniref:GNAT family N-acetyltransferase n=1 Tax=Hydrogenophaga aromaticivorans TaxID=2610898 RepID=UPI001B35BDD8|nr:GNAT family N-acetyltransferase [Hydrogenophaga aromaticivorans]MBQ0917236.1 GNAT family N-acetyltransferase [Hydrogenophaga aromaticivorans]